MTYIYILFVFKITHDRSNSKWYILDLNSIEYELYLFYEQFG